MVPKLAWFTRQPSVALPPRGDGSATMLSDEALRKSALNPKTLMTPPGASFSPAESRFGILKMLSGLAQKVQEWLPGQASTTTLNGSNAFILSERKFRAEQIDQHAESQFEKALFSLKKKTDGQTVSIAWAQGIRSNNPQTREAALTLLRAYLAYNGLLPTEMLSSHTQMKLMIFAPHLSEGLLGKALLYDALLDLPIPQLMDYQNALKTDFEHLPQAAQALLLKKMIAAWKITAAAPESGEINASPASEEFHAFIKSLVIQFYTAKQEAETQVIGQQEKIRLGFLKIQPVEVAFQKQVEEIERRYRLKLRQLKKQRAQKIAESEEEKLRRLEMIYDTVEGSLMAGLHELDLTMEHLVAAG